MVHSAFPPDTTRFAAIVTDAHGIEETSNRSSDHESGNDHDDEKREEVSEDMIS
jgi:hypothetical protein